MEQMGANIRFSLHSALTDLLEKELKEFKWRLMYMEQEEGMSKIPNADIEKAEVCDIIDLLINHYQERNAVEVTLKLLGDINKKQTAAKLKESLKPVLLSGMNTNDLPSRKKSIEENKKLILELYGEFCDYNSLPGEWECLDDRYITLTMTQKHRQMREWEDSLFSKEGKPMKRMKLLSEKDNSLNIDNMLQPNERGIIPKTVVLQGIPGIGKTFTAKKIMLDWAYGKLYLRFDHCFYLKCREMNQLSEDWSVADLIFYNFERLQLMKEEIFKHPENILIVVDGFDELKFSLDGTKNKGSNSDTEWEKHPIEITLGKLLQRKVLSEATMIITTRPEALEKLQGLVMINRYAEILGFSEERRNEYFYKFFKDEQRATYALNYIKENEAVSAMSYVPIMSWLLCTVLQQHLENGADPVKDLKTTTQVFAAYVNIVLNHHTRELEKKDTALFEKLGKLALHGIKKQQVLFEQKDLQQFSFNLSQVPSSFLNKMLFKKDEDTGTVYGFLHLTFQEFHAALCCFNNEMISEVQCLLVHFLSDRQSHLTSTVRFIFGLVNTKASGKVKTIPPPWIRSELLNWMKNSLQTSTNYSLLQLLYCLYETQDVEFTRNAMADIYELTVFDQTLSAMDCSVISYCTLNSPNTKKLLLTNCNLQLEGKKRLLSVLQDSSVRHIELNRNLIGEEGVKVLCTALKDPRCKLETLR
nr:PREDICTED: NACHT, LRR and PYD domains-containing protein 12-like [Latimeria chalumnae]|eukprot:XP_006009704.1 PREDICTED: NACHT, LRR and PYD domains-containing protein 12-like [Latimeria chalumnae]